MNEQLQKAIDDLGILERAKGQNHPVPLALRAELEKLVKAIKKDDEKDKPKNGDKDEKDNGKDEEPDDDQDDETGPAAEEARTHQEHHEGVAMSFKKAATAYEKGDKGTGDVHKKDAETKAKLGPGKQA